MMDIAFLVAWEWFQWIAIRLALFLGLLTLGPSISLILFDFVLYAFRTTFDSVPLFGSHAKLASQHAEIESKQEAEVRELEVPDGELKTECVR
jgi:hypothetical protein